MWVVVVVVGVCGANWSPTEGQAEKKEYRSAQELACQSPPLSISYWEFKGQVDPQHKCDGSSHADCHEVTKSGRLSAGAEGGRDGGREGGQWGGKRRRLHMCKKRFLQAFLL